jgi:hypothetical protein
MILVGGIAVTNMAIVGPSGGGTTVGTWHSRYGGYRMLGGALIHADEAT